MIIYTKCRQLFGDLRAEAGNGIDMTDGFSCFQFICSLFMYTTFYLCIFYSDMLLWGVSVGLKTDYNYMFCNYSYNEKI